MRQYISIIQATQTVEYIFFFFMAAQETEYEFHAVSDAWID